MNKKLGPCALFIISIICFYLGGSLAGVGFFIGGLIFLIASIIEAVNLVKNKAKDKKRGAPLSIEEIQDEYTIASLAAVEAQSKFIIKQFKLDSDNFGNIVLLLHGFCFLMLIIRLRARGITQEKSKHTIDKILRNLAKVFANNNPNEEQDNYISLNKNIGNIIYKFKSLPLDKIIPEYGKYMAHTIDKNNIELKMFLMAGVGITGLIDGPIEKYTDQLINAVSSDKS